MQCCHDATVSKHTKKAKTSVSRKGTEVEARTAELHSKQGNTDITELIVTDGTTQCEKCKETQCKKETPSAHVE